MDPNHGQNSGGTRRGEQTGLRIVVAIGVLLLGGLAGYLGFRESPLTPNSGLSGAFERDLQRQLAVDTTKVLYRAERQLALPFDGAQAIATGPENRIYVSTQQAVHILDFEGSPQGELSLQAPPTSLAVGGKGHITPGQVYVATETAIEVFDAKQERLATWRLPNEEAVITSIAVAQRDVFLADAASRVVWRFDTEGNRLGEIGTVDRDRHIPGLVIPDGHFDVAVGAEDLLYVVDPGRLQIVTFTFAGEIGAIWGGAKSSGDSFFGCCNPTYLAVTPEGRIVTSEKGLPRVRVYGVDGELEGVVAASDELGVRVESLTDPRVSQRRSALSIAVDNSGRVVVLDRTDSLLRIFLPKDHETNSGVAS